jgi:hypothetical protein
MSNVRLSKSLKMLGIAGLDDALHYIIGVPLPLQGVGYRGFGGLNLEGKYVAKLNIH